MTSAAEEVASREEAALMAPLRLSPEDPPERRRAAALEHLESTGFAAGPWEAAAVLAAFGREDDPSLSEARRHARLHAVRAVAADLSDHFYDLGRGERKRLANDLVELADAGTALHADLERLPDLATVRFQPTSTPAVKAAFRLAALPLTDRAQLAAALVVREKPSGAGVPPAVAKRSGLPPFFLIPESDITGLTKPSITAAPPGPSWSGFASSETVVPSASSRSEPPKPRTAWRLTTVCLIAVYAVIRLMVEFSEPEIPRGDSPEVRGVPRRGLTLEQAVSPPLPSVNLERLAVPYLERSARPNELLGEFPADWVAGLPPKPREVLRRLEAIRRPSKNPADKSLTGDGLWVDGRPLLRGHFAPGVTGTDLPAVFATLRSVRASEHPEPSRLTVVEGWLTLLAAGAPAKPPATAGSFGPADE